MTASLRVATRASRLARRQAAEAVERLAAHHPGLRCTIVEVAAAGDLQPDTPPAAMAGQGWFASALEQALVTGAADVAVHSAKDLPSELASGLVVAAYLPRQDPRDAVVTRTGAPWRSLGPGGRLATGSPRRVAQLAALRPDLRLEAIRGNVDTRLARLGQGAADGLVLAMAGLIRLGAAARAQPLDPMTECTPAPAQGAIAIEAPAGTAAADLAAAVDDPLTRRCVVLERAVLAALGGGCRLPLGVLAEPASAPGGGLTVTAAFAPEGGGADGPVRRLTRRVVDDQPQAVGAELAAALR